MTRRANSSRRARASTLRRGPAISSVSGPPGGTTRRPPPHHRGGPRAGTISIAWSTLELTINADGTSSRGLAGASPFPRHWVYDEAGELIEKSAVIDFTSWADYCFGAGTPWGNYESPALTTSVESALENEL